jgi:ParB-like chromosome segregation protein Spo0J
MFRVRQVPVEKVFPYPENPRKNQQAVAKVAASLEAFGWRQPIVVDEAMVIIAGHTRLEAAKMLGLEKVPVHIATDLTPEQVRAYRIADNRTGQEAEWDEEKLIAELRGVQASGLDLAVTGFDADELGALLAEDDELDPSVDPDEVPEVEDDPRSAPGAVWQLGKHRLVCGDATDVRAWRLLLGDERVDMMFTDPPYGVSYVGKTKKAMTIQNDALTIDALTALLTAALGHAIVHSRPGAPWYVAAPHGPQFLAFARVGVELGWWRQTLVWVKDVFVMGRMDYHGKHEAMLVGNADGDPEAEPVPPPELPAGADPTIVEHQPWGYGWTPKGAHVWHGGRKQDTAWEVPRPRANREHPTMKPVELIERALNNSSRKGALVVDPFGGSGSTLIACAAAGRVARLLELDPRYCDVIVRRWENATGQTAVREA